MIAPERLRCFLVQHEEGWTAFCVDADLHATGGTVEAARAALDHALERFCYECDEREAPLRPRHTLGRHVQYGLARLCTGAGPERLHYVFSAPPAAVLGLA